MCVSYRNGCKIERKKREVSRLSDKGIAYQYQSGVGGSWICSKLPTRNEQKTK